MLKLITMCAFSALFLNSCVAPTPNYTENSQQHPEKIQPQVDPNLQEIVDIAIKIQSGRLTEYQTSQLPSFNTFHGRQIVVDGEVSDVDSSGNLSVVGEGIDPIISVDYSPKDPSSTLNLTKDQPVTVRGTITKIKHHVVSSGRYLAWFLSIDVKE